MITSAGTESMASAQTRRRGQHENAACQHERETLIMTAPATGAYMGKQAFGLAMNAIWDGKEWT